MDVSLRLLPPNDAKDLIDDGIIKQLRTGEEYLILNEDKEELKK